MRITGIRFVRVSGALDREIGLAEWRALQPADVDPAYALRPLALPPASVPDGDGVRRVRATFLFVDTDEGISGTSTQIGHDTAAKIRRLFAPWLIGRDPLAIEANWDFMFRLSNGRGLLAASAVDNALWDIRGKLEGVPVYELLGGPRQGRVAALRRDRRRIPGAREGEATGSETEDGGFRGPEMVSPGQHRTRTGQHGSQRGVRADAAGGGR
jgi:L-alanine-DL-glutamate epimerase-like enolase superfamily enzyme